MVRVRVSFWVRVRVDVSVSVSGRNVLKSEKAAVFL